MLTTIEVAEELLIRNFHKGFKLRTQRFFMTTVGEVSKGVLIFFCGYFLLIAAVQLASGNIVLARLCWLVFQCLYYMSFMATLRIEQEKRKSNSKKRRLSTLNFLWFPKFGCK
jgi:hypothetical protein